MSKRRTRVGFVTVEGFSLFDDAVKAATALKKHLKEYCEQKNCAIACYIGISQNESKAGVVMSGLKGKKVYVPNDSVAVVIKPHLHIVFLGNPGQTISSEIVNYFSKRGRKCFNSSCKDSTVDNILRYSMFQSIKCRTIAQNADRLPQDALTEFLRIAEAYNREMNGNKAVFGLPISTKFFGADESVLKDFHCGVFELMKVREQNGEDCETQTMAFTDVFTNNQVFTLSENECETFPKNSYAEYCRNPGKAGENNIFESDFHNFHRGRELQCNINNINNIFNPNNDFELSCKMIQPYSNCLPENIIEGFAGFLEIAFPAIIT